MSVTLLSNDNKFAHSFMTLSLTIFETTGASTCADTMCAAGKYRAPGATSLSAATCADCKPGKYSTAGDSIVFYVLSSVVSLSYAALPPFPALKTVTHMCVYAYANVSICTHLQCDAHVCIHLCMQQICRCVIPRFTVLVFICLYRISLHMSVGVCLCIPTSGM